MQHVRARSLYLLATVVEWLLLSSLPLCFLFIVLVASLVFLSAVRKCGYGRGCVEGCMLGKGLCQLDLALMLLVVRGARFLSLY